MATYTKEQLRGILGKTDRRCHLCGPEGGRLALKHYGCVDEPQGWEVDHSRAKASGGTDRMSNLLPAHASCNRAKQDMTTRAYRQRHGFTRRPMSKMEQDGVRATNTLAAGGLGAVIGGLLFGPVGMLVLAGLGGLVGTGLKIEG